MLSHYQSKTDDYFNISPGNVKKLVPNFFDKKARASLQKFATLFNTRIET